MGREIKISQNKIRSGIAISLDNSLKHLDGVEVLIEKDLLDCGVILIWFAIEEFGRAVYLRERLQKGLETIEEVLERSHKLKYDKAFSVLPKKLETIWSRSSPLLHMMNYPFFLTKRKYFHLRPVLNQSICISMKKPRLGKEELWQIKKN